MGDTDREVLVSEKQRDAERDALRNVRDALDKAGDEDLAARKTRRTIYIVVAAIAVPLLFVLAYLLAKPKELQGPPVVLPQLRQKP